jgi:hypothetical protein
MANQPIFTTANVFNGRMWQLMSAAQKTSHLTGIQEGVILCINQIKHDLHIPQDLMTKLEESGVFDRRRLLFSSQGIVAIQNRINFFYQDSANLQIPIMEAYRHVTLELNFAQDRALQNNLSDLRRKYKQ